ncbi:MJ1255/VC2487 family glycosyltransferase [Marinomonas mediterranea]|jgi:conserved hypothetical protein|uniref:Glycosyltransferase n=1 Tax=Marinomonas mediterranea (strain ATCC 700492 / JCM 21426 / NBRC 103028 / MMB-1) TaxID=717774 RepID=F2JVP1_MARM1|nr:MJ1255/VC2487 family glycosyltransferase [Marinomonas mediterranea]ADZ90585.1 Conserved hypothetical protein CHP00661 [Marinomonas mediterranea MMB-1]WCN08631.1 glycosyltransferase [Marinomonas mediterranea]WCN12685.1 glycosyltransferase [Marinomonas mediterranea]WCN16759.1 glycosyltransferase [Marinomonas mediterranea MMB-1]
MKILYGVQGTGNGHITRARAMADAFEGLDIEVDYVFSGREEKDYFDMEAFGNYRTFKGLSFVARDGKLDLFATCRKASLLTLRKDIKRLDLDGYDLIITDYEPVVAWAAKRKGIRCIGFGHQYAFNYNVPKHKGDKLGAWIMSNFAPVNVSLGAHWHHFGNPILPPLMQEKDTQYSVSEKDVLVYLPFENSEEVMDWLEHIPGYHFRFHCNDIEPGIYDNVTVYPFSRGGFHKNLGECRSVLCNAGFELNSEALMLGRRILAKPLKGQIEQHSNALALDLLGIASTTSYLSNTVIRKWLQEGSVVKIDYPDVASAVAKWICNGAEGSIEELSRSLWDQVSPIPGLDFGLGDTGEFKLAKAY